MKDTAEIRAFIGAGAAIGTLVNESTGGRFTFKFKRGKARPGALVEAPIWASVRPAARSSFTSESSIGFWRAMVRHLLYS